MKKTYKIITLILAFFSFINFSHALTNISINNNKLIPEFDINTHTYNIFVNSKTEIITINVETEGNEIVTGSGSKSLKKGLNEINIISYINEEQVATYKLNIIRGEYKPSKKDATLKNITIKGHEINFTSEKNEYSIEASKEENKLDITYEQTSPTSKVKMTGDLNLNKEENIIKLEVTSEDKKTSNTYIIKVNKKIPKDKKTKKRTSIFDGRDFTSYELRMIITGLIILGLIIIGALFYFIFIKKRTNKVPCILRNTPRK